MNSSDISLAVDSLQADIIQLVDKLPNLKHKKWISRSLSSLVRMAGEEFETLDWKIISASLLDLERGFQIFIPIAMFAKFVFLVRLEFLLTHKNIGWRQILLNMSPNKVLWY